MAREKGWTKKKILILIIIALIAFGVGFVLSKIIQNNYQDNEKFIGEVGELANSPLDYGCPIGPGCEACCSNNARYCRSNCDTTACQKICPGQTTRDRESCRICIANCKTNCDNTYNECLYACATY